MFTKTVKVNPETHIVEEKGFFDFLKEEERQKFIPIKKTYKFGNSNLELDFKISAGSAVNIWDGKACLTVAVLSFVTYELIRKASKKEVSEEEAKAIAFYSVSYEANEDFIFTKSFEEACDNVLQDMLSKHKNKA